LFIAGEILIRPLQIYRLIFFGMVSSLIYKPNSLASVTYANMSKFKEFKPFSPP